MDNLSHVYIPVSGVLPEKERLMHNFSGQWLTGQWSCGEIKGGTHMEGLPVDGQLFSQ
jgi:hypothetical protein